MSVNLHPEVQLQAQTENQDHELASYGGWQEPEVDQTQQPAQSRAAEPLPLLDEDDRVTPEQVQQDRPWWMQPTPRMIVAGGAVMALLYVLFSLFGLWGRGSSVQKSADTLTTMDPLSTNQAVELRLKQLQSENEALKREKLVGDPLPQTTAQPPKGKPGVPKQLKPGADAPRPISIPPRPRAAVAPPPPRPLYVSRSVAPAPPPRPIIRPISSFAARPSPTQPSASVITKSSATEKVEPAVDPIQQWLAAANRGHYVAPKGDSASGAEAQPVSYTQANQTASYPVADSGDTTSTDQTSAYPPTGSDSSTSDQAADYPSPASDSSTSDQAAGDIPTYEVLNPQGNATQTTASLAPQNQRGYPVEFLPTDPNRLLDIGSSAEAILLNGIAWTLDGPEQNRNFKYLLRLKSGFKNQLGSEVLPKGTSLIAQMTAKSDSGLFSLEVTDIIRGPNRQKVPVPNGALQVLAEDGSPLKADLEKKGGRRFFANAASILAPGIERAMESVANSADSLILDDGDRSLIRSSGSSNPLASGISGLANGASRVVGERLDRSTTDTSVPYFKFPGGKAVWVFVNEDVQL